MASMKLLIFHLLQIKERESINIDNPVDSNRNNLRISKELSH